MIDWMQRRALICFFGLAYALSWGGILVIIAAKGFHISALGLSDYALVFVAMALGPSASGLMLTTILDGRAGLRELWGRMRRWRAGARWYSLALFTAPILLLTVLLAMSRVLDSAHTTVSVHVVRGRFDRGRV